MLVTNVWENTCKVGIYLISQDHNQRTQNFMKCHASKIKAKK